MTQDEIIRMAREIAEYLRDCAGSPVMAAKCDSLCEQIALVAAHEREKQAEQEPVAWWFQPPNKNVRPMFDTQQHGGKWQPLYAAPVSIKAAVLAERDACAKVCEAEAEFVKSDKDGSHSTARNCAAAIRARGDK